MEKAGIIVLNYNGGQDVLQCLRSITTYVSSRFPILVIDNCSTDNSARAIREQFARVEFIGLSKNEGYGAAMNRGFLWGIQKGFTSVILLNHDTVAVDDFVTPLITNKADLVGPVIGWHKRGELMYNLGGKILWPWGRPIHIQSTYRPPAYNRKVDYLPGSCLLVRLSVLDIVGGFDQDYFLYFEDVEWSLRAKAAGLKFTIEPKSFILHKVSLATGGKSSPLSIYYLLRNNLFFIWRFGSAWQRVVGTAYVLFLSMWISVRTICRKNRTPKLKAVGLALLDSFRGRRGHREGYP